jgi:uncharacterized protein (DUF924 family)
MKAALAQAFARVRPISRNFIFQLPSRQKLNLQSSKLLQVQSAIQSYMSPAYYSSNATSPKTLIYSTSQLPVAHQAEVARVVDYWFTPSTPEASITEKWFLPPDPKAVDDEIRTNFGSLIQQARNHELDAWSSTPRGALALVILLDQFPRNIYRGSHLSFSSDGQAVDVSISSIAKQFDQSSELTELQTIFLYMPLMHAESMIHQIAGIALFENLAARCLANPRHSDTEKKEIAGFVTRSLAFSKSHRDVIMQFGRFPSRNKALGRESTPEEIAFLEENPGGFATARAEQR